MEKLYTVNKNKTRIWLWLRTWTPYYQIQTQIEESRENHYTIQYHSHPSLCPNQQHWRSWSWMVLWRPIRPFRTNTQKRCPFHYRGLECKSRKSRNTWSDRQIWPWNAEWSRAKTNRVLPRKCTGHSKHPLPTTQEKTLRMDITRWSTPKSDWLYSLQPKMEKLYTVNKTMTRIWLWLRSWTPYCQIQT